MDAMTSWQQHNRLLNAYLATIADPFKRNFQNRTLLQLQRFNGVCYKRYEFIEARFLHWTLNDEEKRVYNKDSSCGSFFYYSDFNESMIAYIRYLQRET